MSSIFFFFLKSLFYAPFAVRCCAKGEVPDWLYRCLGFWGCRSAVCIADRRLAVKRSPVPFLRSSSLITFWAFASSSIGTKPIVPATKIGPSMCSHHELTVATPRCSSSREVMSRSPTRIWQPTTHLLVNLCIT